MDNDFVVITIMYKVNFCSLFGKELINYYNCKLRYIKSTK